MKTLYIGKCNSLSVAIVNRLAKEDEEIYIISEKDFIKEVKPTLKYKFYGYGSNELGLDKVFTSIRPDTVIFAGEIYTNEIWRYGKETNKYLSSLLNILNLSVKYEVKKFIYLSSKEVYSSGDSIKKETELMNPSTYKGILCQEGENILERFQKIYSLNTVILRFDDIYGFSIQEDEEDFFSNIVNSLYLSREFNGNKNKKLKPIHVNDCADGIFRAKGLTPSTIYNVCSSTVYNEEEIANLVNESLEKQYVVRTFNGDETAYLMDNSKIKLELEWVEFYQLDKMIQKKELQLNKRITKDEKRKKITSGTSFMLSLENVIVFLFFATLTILFKNHSMLRTIDFMTLYIVIMALSFGVKQSILSVVLATIFYLVSSGLDTFNIINILTNLEFILKIVQYIFFGASIGYAVDYGKTRIKVKETEYDYLYKEYQEIKEINNDNILIKQEYEKRLLNDRTSLPRLYSIISQLTVLEPEKILTEAIEVIKDIMDTDTVSIYSANNKNSFIRLSVASNNEAILVDKSVDISKYPRLQKSMENNEIYVGNNWSENEPSLAAPVFHEGTCIAIIIINHMKFERLNLYQVNLFRTLSILISTSMAKAREYEVVTRNNKYIEDTEILNPHNFEKLIEIENDKVKKGLANYSIIKIITDDNMKEVYSKISNLFRDTDYFGTTKSQELLVLLGNTPKKDMEFVLTRLMNAGVNAIPVHY